MINNLMMRNEKYIIYKAINTIEERIYIGATTKSLNSRKHDHLTKAANAVNSELYEDIRTYGSDSFV